MNYKEDIIRRKEEQQKRDISMKELQTSLNNIMVDIKTLVERPHWQKLYREELYGILIDGSDKMIETAKIFRKEYNDVFE